MGGISSSLPVSRRGYLSIDELEQFASVEVADSEIDEYANKISKAEETIDSYIRYASKFIPFSRNGKATDGSITTLIDTSSDSPFNQDDDYYKGCEVEILAGANAGERRRVSAYDKSTQKITVADAFSLAIDSTSVFEIYQVGLFPRVKDVWHQHSTYYKRIPESIKRAIAAQVEYVIEKGSSFFLGATDDESESIDDYSHKRVNAGMRSVIAPKARIFLRGFISRIRKLKAKNPTNL